jgi:VCBS repeat protein
MLKRQALLLNIFVVILAARTGLNAASIGFKPAQNYTVGTNPKAIAVGDFNHDGKRDLAVVNYGDPTANNNGNVSILFGNGDGTFQAAKNVAIGKNSTALVVGDFNGDGNDDLALMRPGDPTMNDDGDVTIFLGNGDGTFRQGQVLTPGKTPSSIVAIDSNGDQRLDLAVANDGDQTFSVLLGNGDGSFQTPVAYPAPITTIVRTSTLLVSVDLAGSGEKDLALFRLWHVGLWLANGDGTFRQAGGLAEETGLTAGDFNGDKKDDLITVPFHLCFFGHCGSATPNLYLGNGDGTFQPAISIGQPVSASADFDGDGKLDLAGTNTGSNGSEQILVSLGNGDGTFQQPVIVNSNGSLSQVLDVNGDGAPDLVLVSNNNIGLQLNVGTDFSMSASALSPSTLGPGQSVTSNISLTLLSAFDNPVSLACSVQPAQAGGPTCSLSSNSVTFDGSGKASATLTINAGSGVAARNSFQSSINDGLLWLPVVGFAFLGTGFSVGLSKKRRMLAIPISAVLLSGLIAQVACGGGGPKSTAYTVTVTGSSGATQHSATVSVTAQ